MFELVELDKALLALRLRGVENLNQLLDDIKLIALAGHYQGVETSIRSHGDGPLAAALWGPEPAGKEEERPLVPGQVANQVLNGFLNLGCLGVA